LLVNRESLLGACDGAVLTKERGHVDCESRIANPSAETCDMGAYARHLGHDDDRWTRARYMHNLARAAECDLPVCEVVERIILV
jgi:hypothetical protein